MARPRTRSARQAKAGWRYLIGLGALFIIGLGVATVIASLPRAPSPAPLPTHEFGRGLASFAGSGSQAMPAVALQSVPGPPPAAPEFGGPRVVVPSLGIDARWVTEGISRGSLMIPSNVHEVGIWDAESRLGASEGSVVVAGHVNYTGQGPGALAPLSEVRQGSLVYIAGSSGSVTAWRVTSLHVFAKSALPVAAFRTNGPRQLVLITCGGLFDTRDGSYLDNVVVTALPL